MEKLQTTIKDLDIYKEFAENRSDSEVVLIGVDNLKWLIEQAEKTQELKKDNWKLNQEIGRYSQLVFYAADENDKVTKRLEQLSKTMLDY